MLISIYFSLEDGELRFFLAFDQIFKCSKLYNNKVFIQYNYLLSMILKSSIL